MRPSCPEFAPVGRFSDDAALDQALDQAIKKLEADLEKRGKKLPTTATTSWYTLVFLVSRSR